MNKKIFISHSSLDKEIVVAFVDYLRKGMDIKSSDIFCTSVSGAYSDHIINQQLQESACIIYILSENFFNSPYCCSEIRQASSQQRIYPIVIDDSIISKIDQTSLKGIQYLKLKDSDSLSILYDAFITSNITELNLLMFNKETQGFMKILDQSYSKRSRNVTFVEEIRPVNRNYLCYKISPSVHQIPDPDHLPQYLFYPSHKFTALNQGDQIEVEIQAFEKRFFYDIGTVWNVYPSSIKIIHQH